MKPSDCRPGVTVFYESTLGGRKYACSLLYSTCRRAAQTLGFKRCLTKTRLDEQGTSLLAIGLLPIGKTRGGEHSRKGRPRAPAVDARPKVQWDLLAGVA